MMTTATGKTTDESQIRALMDDRINAVRTKDIDAATANVAADVISFDVVNPLRYVGSDSIRKRLAEWFASFDGPIGFEIRDLSITAGGDVAFCHGLNHVSAKKADGGTLDMWWRGTVCFSKINGNWTITHEHNSVPFNVENGKASLDLKP
jgi:ketosteroid isomerase-like protein